MSFNKYICTISTSNIYTTYYILHSTYYVLHITMLITLYVVLLLLDEYLARDTGVLQERGYGYLARDTPLAPLPLSSSLNNYIWYKFFLHSTSIYYCRTCYTCNINFPCTTYLYTTVERILHSTYIISIYHCRTYYIQ